MTLRPSKPIRDSFDTENDGFNELVVLFFEKYPENEAVQTLKNACQITFRNDASGAFFLPSPSPPLNHRRLGSPML